MLNYHGIEMKGLREAAETTRYLVDGANFYHVEFFYNLVTKKIWGEQIFHDKKSKPHNSDTMHICDTSDCMDVQQIADAVRDALKEKNLWSEEDEDKLMLPTILDIRDDMMDNSSPELITDDYFHMRYEVYYDGETFSTEVDFPDWMESLVRDEHDYNELLYNGLHYATPMIEARFKAFWDLFEVWEEESFKIETSLPEDDSFDFVCAAMDLQDQIREYIKEQAGEEDQEDEDDEEE